MTCAPGLIFALKIRGSRVKRFDHKNGDSSRSGIHNGYLAFAVGCLDFTSFLREISCATYMLNPEKTLEREALRRRIRELNAEIAQHERNLREGEARLPTEEQLALNLRQLIELSIPEQRSRF